MAKKFKINKFLKILAQGTVKLRLSLRAVITLKIPEHLGDSQQILVDDEVGRC